MKLRDFCRFWKRDRITPKRLPFTELEQALLRLHIANATAPRRMK